MSQIVMKYNRLQNGRFFVEKQYSLKSIINSGRNGFLTYKFKYWTGHIELIIIV